jgi:hypothetical protein
MLRSGFETTVSPITSPAVVALEGARPSKVEALEGALVHLHDGAYVRATATRAGLPSGVQGPLGEGSGVYLVQTWRERVLV